MEFIPLYYKEKLDIINPCGDVGIVSLWSPSKVVRKHLQRSGIDLTHNTARIAVIGTLFGEGMPELLRNLLYNPQIRYLLLFGVDLGASRKSLMGFFQYGLEKVTCLGAPVSQILGTNQKIDDKVQRSDFHELLTVLDLGEPGDSDAMAKVKRFFADLPSQSPSQGERREVPLCVTEVTRFPSDPRGHTIMAKTPLDAWKELIYRVHRFGYRSLLKKGERLELQNVKVIIHYPREESEATLKEHGFSLSTFKHYQKSILSASLPPDQQYGYGHRLRGYFSTEASGSTEISGRSPDTLAKAVTMLKNDPESRHVYISLWDTARDLLSGKRGCPCLVSLFFRKFDGLLTMTAVFRTHNALRAWIENVYGLMAIQQLVAERTAMTPGAITVMSHSISIDPQGNGSEQAKTVCDFRNKAQEKQTLFNQDPHGDFLISVDEEKMKIIAEHRFEGQHLKTYVSHCAETLEQMIASDVAVSDVSHALYLGREIGRAEARLKIIKHRKK